MKRDGYTIAIRFASLFSSLTFIRHSSDNRRLTGHDGDGDGDGVTGDGSRLSHDGDGIGSRRGRQFPKTSQRNFQFKHPPPKKNIRFRIGRRNAKALYYPNTDTLLLSLQKP
jgi:hypothetical protein